MKFVWKNKPPKVKTSTMIASVEDGGLKMPSFELMIKSQRIMCLKRLLNNDASKWKVIANALIPLDKFQLLCKLSSESIPKCTLYYEQVLQSWFEFYSVNPCDKYISREILWNNTFVLIDKQPIYHDYKPWLHKGIKYIKDIVGGNGQLLTNVQLEAKCNIQLDIMRYNTVQ